MKVECCMKGKRTLHTGCFKNRHVAYIVSHLNGASLRKQPEIGLLSTNYWFGAVLGAEELYKVCISLRSRAQNSLGLL